MNFFIKIRGKIAGRYYGEGGYKELLILAVPLIFSTGSWALQHFIDRMFLNWYSKEAVAASMPAGILNFTLASLFIGTAGYVSTFVAQYFGSGQRKMIGPVVWQGLYISVISGFIIMLFIPYSDAIFTRIGHAAEVKELESQYFRILCMGAVPLIASSALSGFFSGLGKTWIVMVSNLAATLENIIFDYLLIFGGFGFPEMGIRGAAVATVLSSCVSLAIYLVVLLRPGYNAEFEILRGWRYNSRLFWRLIRFGLPNGVQFFLDVAGFTLFVLFIGRLGTVGLAATNIAFNINTVAFMPMIGLGIAVSVLVGQYLGRNEPALAERGVYSGLQIIMAYMGTVALLYAFVPDIFIIPYAAYANPEEFRPIADLSRVLLKFVALYCLFDAMNILFASAIKGAGDTRFVMFVIIILSIFVLVIPSYIVLFVFDLGIYGGWTMATVYIMALGMAFMIRFLRGKWKRMRVIEESPVTIPPCIAEGPTCQD
jgi:MATE family multidrug resistance protein